MVDTEPVWLKKRGGMARVHVFHHNDADGRAACSIVLRWVGLSLGGGDVTTHEMDYKDTPDFSDIVPADTVVIVDFSFKPDVMQQLLDHTDRVTWCDHHKTAEAYEAWYPQKIAGLRDFSEKGLSGCEVTWKHFFPDEPMPDWLALLGDYDAWRLERAPECFQFYEGLKMHSQDVEDAGVWMRLFREGTSLVNKVIAEGSTAMQYRDMYCAEMREAFGYETSISGVPAYACNIYKFGSKGFGEAFKKYPVCISYAHDGSRFTVSLYSETVDVGEIAKQHGGGGHKGAAGFVCEQLPFARKEAGKWLRT